MTVKENILAKIQSLLNETNYEPFTDEVVGKITAYKSLLSFINTLEEKKDVDLEKEYKEFVVEDPVYNKLVNSIVGKAIAKHFFELGIKANNTSNSFEATVCKVGNTYLKEMDKDAIAKALESYKDGDKVKVIIIKGE